MKSFKTATAHQLAITVTFLAMRSSSLQIIPKPISLQVISSSSGKQLIDLHKLQYRVASLRIKPLPYSRDVSTHDDHDGQHDISYNYDEYDGGYIESMRHDLLNTMSEFLDGYVNAFNGEEEGSTTNFYLQCLNQELNSYYSDEYQQWSEHGNCEFEESAGGDEIYGYNLAYSNVESWGEVSDVTQSEGRGELSAPKEEGRNSKPSMAKFIKIMMLSAVEPILFRPEYSFAADAVPAAKVATPAAKLVTPVATASKAVAPVTAAKVSAASGAAATKAAVASGTATAIKVAASTKAAVTGAAVAATAAAASVPAMDTSNILFNVFMTLSSMISSLMKMFFSIPMNAPTVIAFVTISVMAFVYRKIEREEWRSFDEVSLNDVSYILLYCIFANHSPSYHVSSRMILTYECHHEFQVWFTDLPTRWLQAHNMDHMKPTHLTNRLIHWKTDSNKGDDTMTIHMILETDMTETAIMKAIVIMRETDIMMNPIHRRATQLAEENFSNQLRDQSIHHQS